ncbi:uncharacterized protein Tco025E_09208 [Trypanosoma conorhini]|uniref:Uncharacterized protein n=1 Tax=Trypanosoma conorhini TaxID=83891 RepID=A0A3R7KP32_9TRYP|nr:uncharacterized protein Tco025E_09208 [Trypanosoma conorhini]RNE98515.1 hypothetical protein Tco025E_09208 [Trypanosoma conorhini]
MAFVPASQTAGEGRDVFINHGGAYWLNPVPHGTFRSRSACTTTGATDSVDPFGNAKRPDRPNLFGRSRYRAAHNGPSAAEEGTGADCAAGAVGGGGHSGGGARDVDAAGACPEMRANSRDDVDPHGPSALSAAPPMDARGAAGSAAATGEKAPYSTEAVVRGKLPLDTANPERRSMHPGNHTVRIPPTGGSAYNGTVAEPWAVPRAVDNTYLRLAPLYESTTQYQLRTGRYYTEDEAPAHGMTLPPKSSLRTREW